MEIKLPDGTKEIRRNLGTVGDHHQRNDGRRRTSTMDLVNVAADDARTTQSDQDPSTDNDDVCAIAWKGQESSKRSGNAVSWKRS